MPRLGRCGFAIVVLLSVCTAVVVGALWQGPATAAELRQEGEPAATVEQVPTVAQAVRVKEVLELRTETSKTFELADGQREWVGYTEPVHFRDTGGAFQEIDNSIVGDVKKMDGVDYAYRNGANAYTVRFAAKAGSSRLVTIESEGGSIAFGLAEGRASGAVKTDQQAGRVLAEETYHEAVITYQDVLAGIDLVYQPRSSGVKEYIVIRRPGTQNEFTFDLVLKRLKVKQVDGEVLFVDGEGSTVFVLGPLTALDDAEAWTNDVTYRVEDKGLTCRITVVVPRAYLDDPARVYPVVVDPEIVYPTPTADTYISSANPGTNYSSSSYLRTGRDTPYGIRRSFLKFDQLDDLSIDGDDVTQAYLRIEKYSGVTPNINAWWSLDYFTCTSMTWSSGTPHWDGTSSDRYGSPESTTAYNDSGNWYRMYVTTPVKYFLNGTYYNRGWMIKDTRETNSSIWTTFYASNAGSPHRPELHIVYTTSPPPTTTTTAPPVATLIHYPSYTYTTTIYSSTYESDPVNLFFCDSAYGGTWGSADGVVNQIGYYTAFLDPIIASDQYVLFEATYGATHWEENTRQMATTYWLGSRYHLRIFENPYKSPSGYAAHNNCVGNVHKDSATHGIAEAWETTEHYIAGYFASLHPKLEVSFDAHYNHPPRTIGGWYSNGLITECRFTP